MPVLKESGGQELQEKKLWHKEGPRPPLLKWKLGNLLISSIRDFLILQIFLEFPETALPKMALFTFNHTKHTSGMHISTICTLIWNMTESKCSTLTLPRFIQPCPLNINSWCTYQCLCGCPVTPNCDPASDLQHLGVSLLLCNLWPQTVHHS